MPKSSHLCLAVYLIFSVITIFLSLFLTVEYLQNYAEIKIDKKLFTEEEGYLTGFLEEPKQIPLKYLLGESYPIIFKIEFTIKNLSKTENTTDITVHLPMLKNNSPYQENTLLETSHELIEVDGRIGIFSLQDLPPGKSESIFVTYEIILRPINITTTNPKIDLAQELFKKIEKEGNCLSRSKSLVSKYEENEIESRLVYGFTRAQREDIAFGCLAGGRHAWAEFYVDELGWLPVDVSFDYFAKFPHASHIVEGYENLSATVFFTGGNLQSSWQNKIYPVE